MDAEKYSDILEEHRFTLVSKIKSEVFLDYMRCHHYLDQEDCETIRNNYIYQTRRQKAGAFIDILLTKGPDAFKVFVDLLEWEYPHVYEQIFHIKAKAPPSGYKRHSDGRLSQALHDFVNMGSRERDLMEQNNRLENVLEYAHKELRDLERENVVLRENEMFVRQLEEKLMDSETQVRNLKEENRGFMKKNIQLLEEIDCFNKKLQVLEKDHEALLKAVGVKDVELQRIKESKDQLKESVEEARRESQRIVRLATRIDRNTRKVEPCCEKDRHMTTQLEILRSDLEAERAKNDELCQELNCVQSDLYKERRKIETLNNEMLKVQKDRDQHQLWLTHAERKITQYFNNIQELEREKKKSEEEKIVLQTKSWDVLEQKQRLFAQKHEMERRFDKLQQNYEKLKLKLDFSPMQSQKRFAQYSPTDSDLMDPFIKDAGDEGKNSINSTSSSGSCEINPDFEVFTLCLDILDTDSPIHQWISTMNLENSESKSDVQASGDSTMALHSMFIRSRISWENRKMEGSIPVKEGDILFVNEEVEEQMLQATKVEPFSGHRMKATGTIPNNKEARKLFHIPYYSEDKGQCGLSRRPAIRRNESIPYEIVLPLKATSCLPVLLYGNKTILLPVLELLETRCQDWARVCTDTEAPEWKEMVDDKQHFVVSRWHTQLKDKDLHRFIVMGIKPLVSENYKETIENIFGKEVAEKYCLLQREEDCTQEKETFFHKQGYHCETLSLNDPNISDSASLLSVLKQKVDKVQDSIFWLSAHCK